LGGATAQAHPVRHLVHKKAKLALSKHHQADAAHFDQAKAWTHLINQVNFGPRMPGTPAHDKCEAYILDETKKYCDDAHEQKFTHRWSKTGQQLPMQNIIGTQNWANASVRVVLVTHWDSRAEADQDPNPANRETPIPAANDGASGVAVMLELMRVLKQEAPTVGVMYFFTDGEDLGPGEDEMYLGSYVFANGLRDMKPKPTYGILLDMIGKKHVRIPMEYNSVQYAPDIMNAFYSHAKSIGLGDTFPMVQGDQIDDDHLPLIEKGLPTIDLIDFDYHPFWHSVNDTPDKCSADSLGKVGKMLESWFTMPKPWRPGMG
jgi:glutaminyl-peptide cyclotransferase